MEAEPPANKHRVLLTLSQKVRLSVLGALALYMIVWSFAAWSLIRWGSDIEWVVRANQAVARVERVLSSVEKAETGQRGYLLTGKPSYLADYESGVEDTKEILRGLHSV